MTGTIFPMPFTKSLLSKTTLFTVFLCAVSMPAYACRYQAQPLTQSLERADVAFIGKATYVEGDRSTGVYSTFSIVKPVKNAEGSEEYTVTSPASSCAASFTPEETWLIFGHRQHVGISTGIPSGSLLLSEADGTPICENWAAAIELAPDAKSILPPTCEAK